ncbi:MAG: acyl-CoA dehydrogenase family protein [Deltaproteobacteria bacterium]|nr:acyl-CoA dehydrogenase family protein [Deltaproteobacteria bacterium]
MGVQAWLSAPQLRLRGALATWVEAELDGIDAGAGDEAALAVFRKLAGRGLFRYVAPRGFGGARRRVQAGDLCVIREVLAGVSPLADTLFAVQALAAYPLAAAGTPAQRRAYLPRLAAGTDVGAFALTEPDAGSDPASVRLRARKRGADYVLDGVKSLISNAGLARLYIVFGSTHPARKGKGLSAFVVEAGSAGVAVTERLALVSPHPIGTVTFAGCRVPESQLLGAPGKGLEIALATLEALRCSVGAAACGMAARALAEAVRHARERRQFGRPLARFQAIRFKIADMATELEAARLLVYRAARAHDQGAADAARASSMAKLFATEAAQRIVDESLQIHGGRGLVEGSIMERLYRDVRALRIYEGTSEIQRLIIAREVLGRA